MKIKEGDARGKNQILVIMWLPLIAGFATGLLMSLCGAVISYLPRPTPSGPVSVPWPVCVLGSVGVSLLLPWWASLPLIKRREMRIYFLVCLAAAALFWYFRSEQLLSKVYWSPL